MMNLTKTHIIILMTVSLTAGLFLAGELSDASGADKDGSEVRIETGEFVTPNGTVYAGMKVDKLYDVFQEKDRILIPEAVLNQGCHVFRDITSKNPNDTITFFAKSGRITGWHRGYVAACQNINSIYEYGNNEHIDVWFFPQDKAKWNGAKVSLLDWNKLGQIQRVMFIKEYIAELNLRQKTNINVDVDKYILGMNYYGTNCPKECEFISATGAINNLLVSEGKAKEAKK